jgi:hypothetical protein
MYASAEYLLSGLPVVSTPNKGGRNVFFDKRFVRIVKPDSFAIAQAVKDLASQKIDPFFIREETIKKMIPHEQRFIALLQSIFAEAGIKEDAATVYRRKYVNKLRGEVTLRR